MRRLCVSTSKDPPDTEDRTASTPWFPAIGFASVVLAVLGSLVITNGAAAGSLYALDHTTGLTNGSASYVGCQGLGDCRQFEGVSCTSADDCTAVGLNGGFAAFYATETDGVWGSTKSLDLGNGISCTSRNDCTVVGDGPAYQIETSGKWGAEVQDREQESGLFESVSCTEASDCTAVGYDGGAMYAVESDGRWGSPTDVAATGSSPTFYGVSCTSVNDCTAVGSTFYGPAAYGDPLYATEVDGVWGAAQTINLTGGGRFNSVSCTSSDTCTAVGTSYVGSGQEAIYDTETDGVWGPVTVVNVKDGGLFGSVSCSSFMDCTAVGQGGGGYGDPLYATEVDGVWGTASLIPAVSGGWGLFDGVSCASVSVCVAVGTMSGDPLHALETTGVWATVPGAPKIESVTPGNKTVKVVWTAPKSNGGSAITGYTASATKGSKTFTCTTPRSSCTIGGLKNGSSYEVSVVATNAVGSSESSVAKSVKPKK